MGVTIRIDDEVMAVIRKRQADMIKKYCSNVTVNEALESLLKERWKEVSEDAGEDTDGGSNN